jgi:HPt (histidine-containing phosphotransfer) domain-containing protein
MIDRTKLLELLNGNNGLAQQFIQTFKAETRRQLPLMAAYLEQDDMSMLSNAAHVMKTQTAYIGLEELTKLARFIEEESTGTADPAALARAFKKLEEGLLKVIDSDRA